MRRFPPVLVLLLALASLAGCRRREDPKLSLRGASALPQTLGPGDMRIYNADSSLDLVLVGDTISAGLSEQTVAKVRQESEDSHDSDGFFGRAIAWVVRKTVASTIGTRLQFPLDEVRDVRYQDGGLTVDGTDGKQHDLFSNGGTVRVQTDKSFRPADAERFIAAVQARKQQLGQK